MDGRYEEGGAPQAEELARWVQCSRCSKWRQARARRRPQSGTLECCTQRRRCCVRGDALWGATAGSGHHRLRARRAARSSHASALNCLPPSLRPAPRPARARAQVPANVPEAEFSDSWECRQNVWDPAHASCSVPQAGDDGAEPAAAHDDAEGLADGDADYEEGEGCV